MRRVITIRFHSKVLARAGVQKPVLLPGLFDIDALCRLVVHEKRLSDAALHPRSRSHTPMIDGLCHLTQCFAFSFSSVIGNMKLCFLDLSGCNIALEDAHALRSTVMLCILSFPHFA